MSRHSLKDLLSRTFYIKTALFFTVTLLVVILVYFFISKEHFVYYWDYNGYWVKYQEAGSSGLIDLVRSTARTVRYDDYNTLPVLFLQPFKWIFGSGRIAYILSIVCVYVLPAIFLFTLVCKSLFNSGVKKTTLKTSLIYFVLAIISLIVLPQFWFPTLLGYPDVAGVTIIFGILLIYRSSPFQNMGYKKVIAISALLTVLLLTRRWYSFWIVGFFIASASEQLVFYITHKVKTIAEYLPFIKRYVLTGVIFVILVLALAHPLIRRIINTDYSDIYSSYKTTSSLFEDIGLFISYHGIIVLTIAGFGLYQLIRNPNTRRFAFFLTIQSIITYFLFVRVQDIDKHHSYLFIPTLALCVYSAFATSIESIQKIQVYKKAGLAFAVVLMLVNFSVGFSAFKPSSSIHLLFSGYQHSPLIRNDLAQLDSLITEIFSHDLHPYGKELNASQVYVLSSSFILNDDIVSNRCLEIITEGKYKCFINQGMIETSHVDKRDGFPNELFTAQYIVVTDPPGYHLAPSDQQVIGIPAKLLLSGEGFGTHYEKLGEGYRLDNGVTAYLYKLKSDAIVTDEEYMQVYTELLKSYPDKPEFFKPFYMRK